MEKHLGKEGWGVWLLAMSMVNWFVLLDAGATFAGTRFLTAAWGKKDDTRAASILHLLKTFFMRVATGTAAVCLLLTLLGSTNWLHLHPQTAQVTLLTGLCGLAIAFRFYLRRAPIILRAAVRYDVLSGASIVRVIAQNVTMAWLLTHSAGLLSMAVCYLVCDVLETTLQGLGARRIKAGTSHQADLSTLPELSQEMRSFAILMVVAVVAETLRMQVGPALLGALLGAASVPMFTMGARLITLIEDVVNALFGGQLLAAFAHLHSSQGQDSMSQQLLRVCAVTAGFSAFAVSAGALYGREFIDWLLESDMTAAHDVFLLFAPGFLLRFMQYPAHSALYSMGRQKEVITVTLSCALLGSLLSVPMAMEWGARGIAAAFGAEMIVCYLIGLPWIVKARLGLPLRVYLWRALCRPALLTLAPLLALGWVLHPFVKPDFLHLAGASVAHTLVFLCTAPWFLLAAEDRRQLFSILQRRPTPV
jgi:O-antigen/teichoic acid export membrane protein